MKNTLFAIGSVLLLPLCLLAAPPVEVEKEYKGEVGDFIAVRAKTEGKTVKFVILDPGLKQFPSDLLSDKKAAVFTAAREGKYRVLAYSSVKDDPTEPSLFEVVIGKPAPGPTPPPGPTPGPTPDPNPSVAPIPAPGLRVIIFYESAELAKLPQTQQTVLFSKKLRDYLNDKCVTGEDGKTKEFRIWDKDVDPSGESKLWQDVTKRTRTRLPWIVVSNGKDGFEGPLPEDTDRTLQLIQKYEVK